MHLLISRKPIESLSRYDHSTLGAIEGIDLLVSQHARNYTSERFYTGRMKLLFFLFCPEIALANIARTNTKYRYVLLEGLKLCRAKFGNDRTDNFQNIRNQT